MESETVETRGGSPNPAGTAAERLSVVAESAAARARDAAGQAMQAVSRSETAQYVRDRPMGAMIAAAGLGTLFLIAGVRQRRGQAPPVASATRTRHASYDDLTSSDTPQAAAGDADDEDAVVFAEDSSGSRAARSARVTPRRWPWLLAAVAVGAAGALLFKAAADARVEPFTMELDETDVMIPLGDPVVGD